jgi:hypothetical protein
MAELRQNDQVELFDAVSVNELVERRELSGISYSFLFETFYLLYASMGSKI